MIDKEYYESKFFRSYTDLRKFRHNTEIMISLSSPDGGVQGEFAVRWIRLGDKLTPQIQAYSDSWIVLSCMSDLIEILAEHDGEDINPDELIVILESLGFINTDSYRGDFIPKERFIAYQSKRIRNKRLHQILDNE